MRSTTRLHAVVHPRTSRAAVDGIPARSEAVPGTLAAWDRTLRVVLGAALLWLGWIVVDGPLAAGLGSAGTVVLVTGLAGACPLYALFGLDSRRLGG